MQKFHETRYPPSLSNALLADSFDDFFTAKVEKIYTALVARKKGLWRADDNELPTNAAELNNRPFPSSKKFHFQSEAKCDAIDIEIIFNYDANKTHFHNTLST